ncbi:S-layer protein [Nostocales cyanobacterium HT-58-2]|nr:S-layer protein [Nostocales cyanobacterium HT-58-2]
MNRRYLTILSKITLAASYVAFAQSNHPTKAIASPPVSGSGYPEFTFPTAKEQTAENSPKQQPILADDTNNEQKVQVELPEPVKAAVLHDISQRSNSDISTLRIVRAERTTWSDGCLGSRAQGRCVRPSVPGWQVIVASEKQIWVYHTNESGTVTKLDEGSTQAITATMMKGQAISQQTSSQTTIQQQVMRLQRSTQTSALGTATTQTSTQVSSKKPGVTLAIMQPSGNLSEVIARISVKGKHGKGYFKERFLGDYKYKIKHKAKFVNGLKAGDRLVVRLYDTQNRFIGYSEFECLSANTTVNLILSANPTRDTIVRTVYGLDADFDRTVDRETTTYDYFTQVNGQNVSFLTSSKQIKTSQFQIQGLSTAAATSVYPASFTKGEFAVVGQSVSAVSPNLPVALKAKLDEVVQLTPVSDDDSSIYDVAQLMMKYREVGVASGIRVKFSDVPTNHWAKDFIAELAALEIIEGFPDDTFRPDQQVTRAQFAAMVSQAFDRVAVRSAIKFKDVSSAFWAYKAIREAYQMGFLGSSGDEFNPTQSLTRLEVLLGFARGLNYTVSGSPAAILTAYADARTIRSDVRNAIAALTERGIVVSYPDVQSLNPEKVATRAEVCTLLYKALVSTGTVVDIYSQYAVGQPKKLHCNQGIGNGSEGCDPGKSQPHGGSNDEGGRLLPGAKK